MALEIEIDKEKCRWMRTKIAGFAEQFPVLILGNFEIIYMILKYSQQTQDMAKPKQFWFEHQHNNEIFFFLAYFIVQFKQEKQQ